MPYRWTFRKGQLIGFNGRRWVELVEEEVTSQIEEVVLANLQTDSVE